jgi:hypothetical protein
LKENNCQPRLLYPAKLSFTIEGEIKTFEKQKLKQFMTTKLAPQKIPEGILHREEEDKYHYENTRKTKSY